MFHFQDPALLCLQDALESTERRSNLITMLGGLRPFKEFQMRAILDGADPNELVPVCTDIRRMASSAKRPAMTYSGLDIAPTELEVIPGAGGIAASIPFGEGDQTRKIPGSGGNEPGRTCRPLDRARGR